jgi:hypothetical protein
MKIHFMDICPCLKYTIDLIFSPLAVKRSVIGVHAQMVIANLQNRQSHTKIIIDLHLPENFKLKRSAKGVIALSAPIPRRKRQMGAAFHLGCRYADFQIKRACKMPELAL